MPYARGVTKNGQLRHMYGIGLDEYLVMIDRQDGVCAICKKSPSDGKALFVDHHHKTGVVLGLLCDACKTSIGRMGESPAILQNAIMYLVRGQGDRSWDRYFLNLATMVASRSKDVSTQVGAVITRDRDVISSGFNGFHRGADDERLLALGRPDKYKYVIHAEMNAIINCTRVGVSSEGGTIYVTSLYPCSQCANAIVNAGIKRVVFGGVAKKKKWVDEFEFSKDIFGAGGVVLEELG